MFHRHMPALTLFTFCVGVGLGISWDYGLIPLTITPANSGTLGVEVTQREALPPPNETWTARQHRQNLRGDAEVDPEIFEQQSEPDSGNSATTVIRRASLSTDDRAPASLNRSLATRETSADRDEFTEKPERPVVSPVIRKKDRNALQLDSQAGIEEAPAEPKIRKVKTTAHVDPAESRQNEQLSPREALAAAEEKLASGETLAAHRDLSKLYWNYPDLRPRLQELIDSTAKAIFFQPKPHYIEPYVIQEGERLQVIAKKYNLTWEYLAKLNHTDPKRIQIGQKLKVVKGPFAAVVDLGDFAMTVHLQGYYVKRYMVGIGQDGSSPIGKFPVLNKVENPQYTDPTGKVIAADDPSNPLGERWIDLGNSYGIHGTVDPGSIGKAKSRGCIRLNDKDVIEVYDFLVKGSEVVIRK